MAPKIPDRWIDYKPIGKKIEGTRFIAFKVPLKEHIAQKVDSDIRLDGSILLKMIPNLGLIIDLTNTYRYYDPKIFQKEGVEHKKLMIPGHETPSKHLVDEFNAIVKEFMENNTDNDKLIGVHCTHGVNRTGYLICNYMISQMTIDPNEAIDRFANARGHKIERHNYIDALHKLLETNVQINSNVEGKKAEIINWRERSIEKVARDNSRERNPNTETNNYRKSNDVHSRNSNRDQSRRAKTSHDSYSNIVTEINNWRERSIEKVARDNSRERNPNTETNNYRKINNVHSRNSNRDQSGRAKTSHDSYRNRARSPSPYDSYRNRSRLTSPPPYYANNRNVYFYRRYHQDNYRFERPYYPVPPLALPENQEQLRIPNYMPPHQQPLRLRLDYYNARPVDRSQGNNRHIQRFTYVRKTNHL